MNHFRSIALATGILAGSLLSCSAPTNSMTAEQMRELVRLQNDRLGHFFMKGDADSLGLMYGADARLCLNGIDFVTGRSAITEFWRKDMRMTKTNAMRTETLTVGGVKEVVYETGRTFLNITYADSTFDLTVKYCNVWRRQPDGKYLLDVDIANRDKP